MSNRETFSRRDKAELFDLMLSDPRVTAGQGFTVSFGDVYLDAIRRNLDRALAADRQPSSSDTQPTEA